MEKSSRDEGNIQCKAFFSFSIKKNGWCKAFFNISSFNALPSSLWDANQLDPQMMWNCSMKKWQSSKMLLHARFPSFSISRVFYYWWWPPSSSTFTRYILIFNYFGRYLILLCSPFSFLLLSLSAMYWLKLHFSSAANESTRTRVIFYTVGEYLGCC